MKAALFFIFMAAVANAAVINASVEKTFITEPFYFKYNDTIREFSTETSNSGSLPYASRFRVDVGNFTAWSEKRVLLPGNNAFYQLYWLPDKPGNYTTRYRIYYGGEVNESTGSIIVEKTREKENVFNITLEDTLGSFLVLKIMSGVDTKAVVIPQNYPHGMWVAQKTLTLEADSEIKFLLPYYSPVKDQEITIAVASEDGKYAGSTTVKLEESKTLKEKILRLFFAALA